MSEERVPAPKAHPLYVTLLGASALSPFILAFMGWLASHTVETFDRGIEKLAGGQADLVVQVTKLSATMDAWASRGFVSRELFEAFKQEMERRLPK